MKVKTVRPSMTGSIEGIMHTIGHKNFALQVSAEPARSILKVGLNLIIRPKASFQMCSLVTGVRPVCMLVVLLLG